jgi:hypothetical protein
MKRRPCLAALVAAILLGASPLTAAELYFWTDENGVRHYSNTGLPDDARQPGTRPEVASPAPAVDSDAGRLDRALDSYQSGSSSEAENAAREAERAQRREERQAAEIDAERQRLQAEIQAVDNLAIGKSFTQGMKENRAGLLKRKLALLNSDPDRYFDLKRQGQLESFAASAAQP